MTIEYGYPIAGSPMELEKEVEGSRITEGRLSSDLKEKQIPMNKIFFGGRLVWSLDERGSLPAGIGSHRDKLKGGGLPKKGSYL